MASTSKLPLKEWEQTRTSEPSKTSQFLISRWGEEWQKTFNPPPLHFIPHNLSLDELEYIIRLYRLDEVTKKILLGDYANKDTDIRSPSPDPIYDGKTG